MRYLERLGSPWSHSHLTERTGASGYRLRILCCRLICSGAAFGAVRILFIARKRTEARLCAANLHGSRDERGGQETISKWWSRLARVSSLSIVSQLYLDEQRKLDGRPSNQATKEQCDRAGFANKMQGQ
ncbi:uncharacterized protein BO97DRAFT_238048 [Aspergillus homomorphus CBS 101889]|uniref:Uncharacterized protein n=1 Tax=Aspergillus homomorphus (strain CBS 101889) TaxID=1450537 RepID=A0A395I5L7_ASPHC|nr:hypothetical protein BO97DRAFT_238048 [Aspergillus homomorphus CBS 101889]RAL15066.1 hypothetical protein BO97DRAFT_238048 [Aspergillus homomorphus CBS 101889]